CAGAILRSPNLELQVKAKSAVTVTNTELKFALDVKNYNDLRLPSHIPRLLILLLLPTNKSMWVSHSETELSARSCAYWYNLVGSPPTKNSSNITVTIP